MKNKAIRMFTATLAAVLCMAAFSVTAYAGGVDPDPERCRKPPKPLCRRKRRNPTTRGA